MKKLTLVAGLLLLVGCSGDGTVVCASEDCSDLDGVSDAGAGNGSGADSGAADGATDSGDNGSNTDSGSSDNEAQGETEGGRSDGAGSANTGTDGGVAVDAGATDGGATDSATTDSGVTDTGSTDSGSTDSGATDGGSTGGGTSDSGTSDGGTSDSGAADGGSTGGSDGGSDGQATDGGSDGASDGGSTDGGNTNGGVNDTFATGLSVSHRSGQSFLVWDEPDQLAHYHVYRSNQPITTENLSAAEHLTSRWGPIDQDSSVNKHGNSHGPDNFVIEDLAEPLDSATGLFVHTTQNGQQGNAYYAVTTFANGTENREIVPGSNATVSALAESVTTPQPVLIRSVNEGKGRTYTQYMDYANWNPTFNGYAFDYSLALPVDYNPARSYPLSVQLHEFGLSAQFLFMTENNWQVIQLFPNDPGPEQNAIHSWWYGHAADHNYLTDGSIPTAGRVENFTEQRVMQAIDEVIANADFNVNTELVHAYGNSMGASGVLSLGLRYPDVFAGVYSSQPMTNYAASPVFQEELVQLWGQQSSNLGIVNTGPSAGAIADYDVDGSQPTGVWDWMNHQQQLVRRAGDELSFLIIDIGKADTTIDWFTQGLPMIQALTDGKAGFAATALDGVGHGWQNFNSVNHNMFGFGEGVAAEWRYPTTLSFPALQNASGSGPIPPATNGDDEYNISIDWSTPQSSFGEPIVDALNRYEITLRSLASVQTVSVTPRNTVLFRPASGEQCSWTARNNNNNSITGSGSLTVDNNELATAPFITVNNGAGTRLVMSCP